MTPHASGVPLGRSDRAEPRAGAGLPAPRRARSEGPRVVGVGVGGVEAVPRSLNYVAFMEAVVLARSGGVLSVMLNGPEQQHAGDCLLRKRDAHFSGR